MKTLLDTKNAFEAGSIAKPDFIRGMYEDHHAKLFDYAEYLGHANIAAIEITEGRVTMTSRREGIRIVCPKGDYRVAPIEILNFADYEIVDSNMILRLVGANDCVLDVGANMGWYSILIAKTNPAATVHAFEPLPNTYSVLRDNVALNDMGNVIIHPFGLSSEKKDLRFFFYPEGSGNASAVNLTGRSDAQEIVCHVEVMDEAVKDLGIARVDFIKCDVEGAELFVFQGGMKTIARDKPVVFSEMLRKWSEKFDYHPNQIIDLFRGLGYRCFTAEGEQLREFFTMDLNTLETNFFFLHGEKHAAQIQSLLIK
jgi:FkbM family methyltransferase